jgi:predicted ATP-dependent Lon-type protease
MLEHLKSYLQVVFGAFLSIDYYFDENSKESPFLYKRFKTNTDAKYGYGRTFQRKRKLYDTQEWLDVIIRSTLAWSLANFQENAKWHIIS